MLLTKYLKKCVENSTISHASNETTTDLSCKNIEILCQVLQPGSLIGIQLKGVELPFLLLPGLENLKQYKWLQSLCPVHCFSFDSSAAKDPVDRSLRWFIWRCDGPGLVTLWRVWRKPDKDSAGRPSASQSLNGAMADPPPKLVACTFSKLDLWKLVTST